MFFQFIWVHALLIRQSGDIEMNPGLIVVIDFQYVIGTYLDSSNQPDGDNFNFPGYNVVRANHSSNTKEGGACIYFKNSLPLKVLDIQLLQ